jgi:5'-3' exoribonuclease 1
MGVPKFFRWLSERYPFCMQLVEQNAIPEFDHLYLDMNGIIHTCTKPSGQDAEALRLPEEEAVMNIMAYVDLLFKTIRPKKVFFLAIDGVAPRAKMNQQRARRFRTARDNAANKKKREDKLQRSLASEELWDSNCITPGTEFLTRLAECIRFMICKKIGEDPVWREVNVIFSGPEVPGEGEHKIMDYIRFRKSQPNYDPNTRHCLYGLDADLIMLALLSHEPHFALLREEVLFGKKAKQAPSSNAAPLNQKFYLLHVCLIREYFDLEFRELKPHLSFEYDLERIIDDFILFMYFVGNDFLPNLPNFHINDGGLKIMFDEYKNLLPTLDGYINDHGILKVQRLEMLIRKLQMIEDASFARHLEEVEELQGRQQERRQPQQQQRQPPAESPQDVTVITVFQQRILKTLREFIETRDRALLQLDISSFTRSDLEFLLRLVIECTHLQYQMSTLAASSSMPQQAQPLLIVQKVAIVSQEEFVQYCRTVFAKYQKLLTVEEDPCLRNAVVTAAQQPGKSLDPKMGSSLRTPEKTIWKSHYYQDKLDFDILREPQLLHEMVSMYVDGLQWVLHYYYRGVPSWGWYYPYHYAPLISDLVDLEPPRLFSEKGTPFRPLEQLMAVLPPFSKDLVPKAFRDLMLKTSPGSPPSPILDFYPTEFRLDMNGKKNDWEAVVLIPFIQEDRLLAAMHERQHLLTNEERKRNQFGNTWLYHYDHRARMARSSPVPSLWTSLQDCPCHESVYLVPSEIPESTRKHGLCDGYRPMPGFPTLHSLEFETSLRRHRLDIFGCTTESETMVLSLPNHNENLTTSPQTIDMGADLDSYLLSILEESCYIQWPFLIEGRVVAAEDALHVYRIRQPQTSHRGPKALVKESQTAKSIEAFKSEVAKITKSMERRYAVLIGPVKLLLHVTPFKEMISLSDGTLVKSFGKRSVVIRYPVQLMVRRLTVEDLKLAKPVNAPIPESFKIGQTVFYVGDNDDGDRSQPKIQSSDRSHNRSPCYGRLGIIIAIEEKTHRLTLDLFEPYLHNFSLNSSVGDEPSNGGNFLRSPSLSSDNPMMSMTITSTVSPPDTDYQSDDRVALLLGVSQRVLSKITSSYLLQAAATSRKYNVGLNLKFEVRQEKVDGYTRRNARSHRWEYSGKAIDVIGRYFSTFPQLIEHTSKSVLSSQDMLYEGDEEDLKRMKSWLREQQVDDLPRSPVDSRMLDVSQIQHLQQHIDAYHAAYYTRNPLPVRLQHVSPKSILVPATAHYRLTRQAFNLYDRVILVATMTGIVHAHSTVPVGSYGTVVGVCYPSIDVLLDEPMDAATDLNGRCDKHRGITVPRSTLLNLTHIQSPLRQSTWHPIDDVVSLPAKKRTPLPSQDYLPPKVSPSRPSIALTDLAMTTTPTMLPRQILSSHSIEPPISSSVASLPSFTEPPLGMTEVKLLLPTLDYKVAYIPVVSQDQLNQQREISSKIKHARHHWLKHEQQQEQRTRQNRVTISTTSQKDQDLSEPITSLLIPPMTSLHFLDHHRDLPSSASSSSSSSSLAPHENETSRSNRPPTLVNPREREPLTWQQEKLFRSSLPPKLRSHPQTSLSDESVPTQTRHSLSTIHKKDPT